MLFVFGPPEPEELPEPASGLSIGLSIKSSFVLALELPVTNEAEFDVGVIASMISVSDSAEDVVDVSVAACELASTTAVSGAATAGAPVSATGGVSLSSTDGVGVRVYGAGVTGSAVVGSRVGASVTGAAVTGAAVTGAVVTGAAVTGYAVSTTVVWGVGEPTFVDGAAVAGVLSFGKRTLSASLSTTLLTRLATPVTTPFTSPGTATLNWISSRWAAPVCVWAATLASTRNTAAA